MVRVPLARSAVLCLTGVALALSAIHAAGQEHHEHGSQVGWVPREVLERPVTLRSGLGTVHEEVSTSSSDAQAFYDQGLAYLHSYIWIEAARSFHQALRHDPDLAMAHLGLSYAFSGLEDLAGARRAFEAARTLAGGASARERQRLEIRRRQLAAMANPDDRDALLAYRAASDEALEHWPDDPELWLLRGNAAEASPFGRGQRGREATIPFYEAALERVPDHFAAHHYLTHTYETMGDAERALVHGEAYARLSPAVPHAQHMYGHDLRRVGRVDEAVAQFEKTRRLEEAYFSAEGIRPEYDWHYAHNLSLLAAAYQYRGQMTRAAELLQQVYALPKFTERFQLWSREWPDFLLGRGRVDEVLDVAREMLQSESAAVRTVARVLVGQAHLTRGRTEEARDALMAARKELQGVKGAGPLPVTPQALQPSLDTLEGELLLRTGKAEEGARLLRDVQQRVRAAPGADAWIQGLFRLEAIARSAREAGHWELAEHAARQMLDHDEAYAGTHYALALVAQHRGDLKEAAAAFATAIDRWAEADDDLPELAHARRELAGIQP